jgi:hypothetical protein
MNTIQILQKYVNRTEYKILKEWFPCVAAELDSLAPGTALIPGSILNKLTSDQIKSMISWIKKWGNQLILTPPWRDIDLGRLLELSNTVAIKSERGDFQGIATGFVIQSNFPSKWQNSEHKSVAIDLKHHLGSGTISITTVPLLDYRRLEDESQNKALLAQLISTLHAETNNNQEIGFALNIDQLRILLLAAANIDITRQLREKVKAFFAAPLEKEEIILEVLRQHGFLDAEWQATKKATQMLLKKGYHAFIRELRKQGDRFEW